MVLHLGIGNVYNAIAEPHVVAETARRMGAEKVWFIHNHPSGDVVASREDINIHNILKEQLGGVLQPSIIINTDTGKYGVYTEKCNGTHYWDWYTPSGHGKKYVQIPVYAFDKSVFHGKGLDRYTLRDTGEVAKFLSTQRLGERDKYSVLAIDNKLHLNGYYHLPYSDLGPVPDRELVEHVSSLLIHSQARYAILVGKDDGQLMQRANDISSGLEKYSGGNVMLTDVVQMRPDNHIRRSWYSEKMESREQEKERNPHMRIVAARESKENQPVVDNVQIAVYGQDPFQSGRIRCRIDGEWQMYRDMRPADFNKWRTANGNEKAQLANALSLKYFHDRLESVKDIQPGFKG